MEPGAPTNSHPSSPHPSTRALLGASPALPNLSPAPGRARGRRARDLFLGLTRWGAGGTSRVDRGPGFQSEYWGPLTVPVRARLERPFPAEQLLEEGRGDVPVQGPKLLGHLLLPGV